ncbi:hypothetical protein A1Q_2533 [Vibrio campbellii HY01]|nr:hypothetical protein A1Q_2533 [Vibrio campbellii HY01]
MLDENNSQLGWWFLLRYVLQSLMVIGFADNENLLLSNSVLIKNSFYNLIKCMLMHTSF